LETFAYLSCVPLCESDATDNVLAMEWLHGSY